jgi:acyl-CoA synthetase (AMP-forming)/AMP-acid ligase II
MLLSILGLIGALLVYLYITDSVYFGMLRNIMELFKILKSIKAHDKRVAKSKWTFPDEYEKSVDKNPDNVLFVVAEDGQKVTRKQVDDRSNQIANWGKNCGLKQGETVALMMFNKPDFFAFWLGMSKIGVSSGLLNTNLTGKSLLHSVELAVKSSETKILVLDSELKQTVQSEVVELEVMGIKVYYWDEVCTTLQSLSTKRPSASDRGNISDTDNMIYIYTSGTTGMPKASKISHTRFYNGGNILHTFCSLKPGQNFYCCLPLYHSAAGVLALSGILKSGATMILR